MKKLMDLDRNQTKKLALDLAKKYEKKRALIGLVGVLGAGKTAFAKDFASYFGIKKIKSPTFIIGSVYPIGNRRLYHYDFYRLNRSAELEPLELDEIIRAKNRLMLIEWVDKFPKIQKQCNLIIKFEISGKNTRNVTIS